MANSHVKTANPMGWLSYSEFQMYPPEPVARPEGQGIPDADRLAAIETKCNAILADLDEIIAMTDLTPSEAETRKMFGWALSARQSPVVGWVSG